MSQRYSWLTLSILGCVAFLLFVAGGATAGTTVGTTTYTSDETWTVAGSPYDVTGYVYVHNGATLTVEAGVTVNFASSYRITVGAPSQGAAEARSGHLVLDGTEASPVTINGGAIYFDGWNGAAAPSFIRNTTFNASPSWALRAHTWSLLEVHDSTFLAPTSGGAYLSSSSPTFSGTTFDAGPYGLYATAWDSRPTVRESHFENQTTRHARVGLTSLLMGNSFTGTGDAVELLAGSRWIDETDVVIRNEGVRYDLHNWFGFRHDRTLHIEPGVDIRAASDVTIYIGHPSTQATAGLRAMYGNYHLNETSFAFQQGAAGSGCVINGPDARGYVCEAIPHSFTNVSTTGTPLSLCSSCMSAAVPIGFDFGFYDGTYSQLYVAANGFVTFSPGQSGGCCTGQALPQYGSPDNLIAGYWDRLHPGLGGSITYETIGVAPNRAFIVQWTDVHHCCSTAAPTATFQIVLHEGTNVAEVHIQRAISDGSTHVTGVESAPLPEFPRGHLDAQGTVAEPIVIRGLSGSTSSGWNGFRFQGWSGTANADVALRNVTLTHTSSYGAYFHTWSPGTFDNVTIGPTGSYGLYLYQSSPTFRNAWVKSASTHNVYAATWSSPTFLGGTIEKAAAYGIYTSGADSAPTLVDVTFRENAQRPLRIPIHAPLDGVTFESNGIQQIEYSAQTYVGDVAFRPYYDSLSGVRLDSVLLDSITVRNGGRLTLEPDLRLLVESWVSINVGSCCSNPDSRGNFTAEGTQAAPIYVGARSGSATTGWYGFYFRGDYAPGSAVMRNTTVAFSRDANVELYAYDDFLFDNVTLDRSERHGIISTRSSPTLVNVNVTSSGWEALYFYQSTLTWKGGHFSDTGRSGVYGAGCGSPTLQDIVIDRPNGWGVYASDACAGAHLTRVDIRDATNRPWRLRLDNEIVDSIPYNASLREVEYWGVDVTSDRTLPIFYDAKDGGRYTSVIISTFTVRNTATWTLPPNTRLLVEAYVSINVGSCCSNPSSRGNLSAEGTQAEPIHIGARSGDDATGWYGFYFRGDYAGGTSVIRNATIAHSRDDNIQTQGYNGLLLDNVSLEGSTRRALYLISSNPTLTNVDVKDAGWEAMYFSSSSPTWIGGRVSDTGRSGFYGSGCGTATLVDLVVENVSSYGHYSDGACNGAHLDGVEFKNVSNRAWRNRLDVRYDVVVDNATVNEVEYWGNDITSDRALPYVVDQRDGVHLPSAILGTFTVRNTATWTVPAGSDVRVDNYVHINVGSCCSNPASRGNLSVEGTQADPVRFSSRSGSATTGWYGFYFRGDYAGGTSIIRNTTIELSRDEGIDTHYYSGLTLDNVTLDRNARWGVEFYGGANTLTNVRINGSGSHGLYLQGGASPSIHGGVIENSGGYGVYSTDASTGAHVYGTLIQDNAQRPLRVRITDTLVDVELRNNGIRDIEYWGVDITSDRTLAPMYDATDGARHNSILLSTFTVHSTATWTILPDTRLLVENAVAINVGSCCSNPSSRGNLTADGTAAQPIYVGSRSGSATNGWYGFYFRGDYAGGTSTLRNATVAFSRDEGVDTHYYSGLTLDNVTLDRNARWGVELYGGSPTLRNVVSSGSGSSGVRIYYGTPSWEGGGVTGSGGHGIHVQGCGVATLRDLVVANTSSYGLYSDSSCAGANMERVHFADTGNRPYRNLLDASVTNVTTSNPGIAEVEVWGMTLSGARTLRLEPVRDATTDAPLPTVVLGSFTVNAGAELELGPGMQLRFRTNEYVTIGSSSTSRGMLTVRGTRDRPVNISGTGTAPGAWGSSSLGGLYLPWTNPSVLQNVTIDGALPHGVRMINDAVVTLDNVTVKRSTGSGVVVGAGAHVIVQDSLLTQNGARAIYLDGSLEMRRSNVSHNANNGIEVRAATVDIRSSIFYENAFSGINSSTGNPSLWLSESYLQRNGYYGVDLQGTTGSVIVNNAFMENVQGQAHATAWNQWNLTPTPGRNIAYGPFVAGNSWSDYPGEDTDADGLGDTLVPYTTSISPGGDHHPVMGNLYADFTVEIADVVGAPHEIGFRDASRGGFSPADQWVWDVGDGAQYVTQNVTHTYAADGSYAVELTVANPHGQVSQVTRIVHVDSVPPITSIALDGVLGLDDWYTSAVDVTLNATDDRSGVDHTSYSLDGGPSTAYAGTFAVTAEGPHEVAFHSVDENGNAESSVTAAFRVDRTLPTALDAELAGTAGRDGWFLSDVYATLNATDDVSGLLRIDHAWNDTPSTEYTTPVHLAEDGVFLLRYLAVDNAGLVSAEQNATLRRDTTLPTLDVTEQGWLGGGGVWLGPVTVNASAEDATSGLADLNYTLNGGPETPVNGSIVVSGHGVHELNFTAIDVAGNANETKRLVIQIDLEAPVSEHHFDGDLGANGVYISAVNVTFSGNDSGSGISHYVYSLDGGANVTYDEPVHVAVDGQHRLTYHAVDVAGNAETIHEVVLFLDLEAPTTNLNLTGAPGLNGWWLSNVTGELSVENPDTLDSILYTLDGGDEVTYVTPFPINGEGVHNVTFHAISVGGLVEANQSRNVRLDLTPPALEANVSGDMGLGGWHVGPVQLSLLATDAASGIQTTRVSVDGAPLSTYTGVIPLAQTGTHTLDARTVDVAGRATDLAQVTFNIDLDDPVTTLALSPAAPDGANGWYVSAPTVTLTAADVGAGVDRILLAIDGGPEEVVSGPIALGEGVHDLEYRAVDLAGRVEATRNMTVRVDLTPPALDDTVDGVPGLEGWFVSAVNVTLAATDATSGVAQILASVDGAPEQPVTDDLVLSSTGPHDIAWRALDSAGLETSGLLTLDVDRHAPTTTLEASPNANAYGWRKQAATVTLSATDQPGLGSGVASILRAIDGGAFEAYSGAFTVGEGFHNVSFYGVDVAGLANATQRVPVKVDVTPPDLAHAMRAPDHVDGWYLAPVQVNLTAADALSGVRAVEWWIDSGGVSSTTGRTIHLAKEGQHELHVRARDFADTLSPVLDVPYKLDLDAPISSHALAGTLGGSNRSAAWYRTPVDFTMTSTDAGAGIATQQYRLGGGDDLPYDSTVTFAQEGAYELTYFATDLVDREELPRVVPRFGVDLTAPVTSALIDGALDPHDGVYKTIVNVSLASQDALSGVALGSLQARVGDAPFAPYAGPITLDTSGDHVIEFFAKDVAGNLEQVQRLELTLFVDTTPPVTTLTPEPDGWFGAPIVVQVNAADAQSSVQALLLRLDGGDLVEVLGNETNLTIDAEGIHTLEYAAIDIAGNLELFREVSYQVDLTPPNLSVAEGFTQGANGWIVSWVNLTPDATDALSGVERVVARVNGIETVLDGPLAISQSGFYNVTLVATDAAGLASEPVAWSGRLDLDAPRATALVVGPEGLDGWHRDNVSVLLSATDATSGVDGIEYRWDNDAWDAYPGSPFQFSDEGLHVLDVRVRDLAGNLAASPAKPVGIDRTPPVIATTLDGTRGEAGWFVSEVLATTDVEDVPGTPGALPSGVHNVTRVVNGGANETIALPSSVRLDESRVHTLSGYARDLALNGRAETLTIPVDLDDPTLDLSIDGPAGLRGWFTGPVLVNASSVDPTSGPALAQRITNDGAEPITGPIRLTAEGTHAFVIHALDVAGRVGENATFDVQIDGTPPELAALLDGPQGANGWFTGPTSVRLDASDLVSGVHEIRYTLDDGPLLVYEGAIRVADAGLHVVNYTGIDVAGNALSREISFGIDVDAPEADHSIDEVPSAHDWFRTGVNVTLSAHDLTSGVAQIEYTFDLNASWTEYVGPIAITAEGNHTLYYRAIDESGRPSIIYSHHIRIDLTTPVLQVRLENTLYTQIDGRIYIEGDFCIEITGIDALSGLRDIVLQLTGAIEKVIVIDLSVSLHCFDAPDDEGWSVAVAIGACDLGGLCDFGELDLGDGGGGGGGPGMVFLRPFPGAVNLQHVSIPVFRTAFQEDGAEYETGTSLEYTDPDDPSSTREFDGVVRNPTPPGLAQTTIVAGSRVPVWITATGINPITAEFYIDDVKIAASDVSELVRYERFSAEATVEEEGVVEPSFERQNVTQKLFVFQLDTFNLTAGEHVLSAKGVDRKGRTATGSLLVDVLSPAVGNVTANMMEDAATPRDQPGQLPPEVPRPLREMVPGDLAPPLPPEAQERIQNAARLGRIVLDMLDALVIDNYAYVDETMLRFYETYETTSALITQLTGQPDPVTVYEVAWHARAPGPGALVPEEDEP